MPSSAFFNGHARLAICLLGSCVLGFGAGCVPRATTSIEPPNATSSVEVPTISRSGPLGVGIDRSLNTPLTARGRCLDAIIDCHSATDEAQDRCVNQLRRCETARPWEESLACCPSGCMDAYLLERRKGVDARQATIAGFAQRGCYPGVEQMIRNEPWN